MAFGKQATRKCSNCTHIDRETYRAVKADVCYLVGKKDGEPVATTVTSRTTVCQYWREEKKAGSRR